MSSLDFDIYYKNNKNYRGCWPRDRLPDLQVHQFAIINLDDSSGPGTHWCVLFRTNDRCYYWFDSFGVYPPPEISKKVGTNILLSQNDQIQDLRSEACGWYCMAFVNYIEEHDFSGFAGFLNLWSDDSKKNDEILASYLARSLKS